MVNVTRVEVIDRSHPRQSGPKIPSSLNVGQATGHHQSTVLSIVCGLAWHVNITGREHTGIGKGRGLGGL